MRVLFTAAAVPSHFHVQIPLARALREAGHAVAFASGPQVVPRIERAGFQAFAAGPGHALPSTPPPADPSQRTLWTWEEVFAGPPAAERLADLRAIVDRWGPDVLVRENAELAGCVAAEAAGIPHAVVQNGNIAMMGILRRGPMRERLDTLRSSRGLPPDPDLAMLYRYLLLLPVPRSVHEPSVPLPPTAHFLRPLTYDQDGDESAPAWLDDPSPRPLVYATFGTVFNSRVDLFTPTIAALRDEPVNLVVTVGRDQDPDRFGPQPENVRIERYIPNSLLLPRCTLLINIAGMNSVRSAFEHGMPMVLLPLVAEHAFNAQRCAALRVARVLDPRTMTPEVLREAVREVLGDPSYRANAVRMHDELAAMPGPEYAVTLLERLAVEKGPVRNGLR